MKLPGSSAIFGPSLAIYLIDTQHILWAVPCPSPGEAPDGRLSTSHGIGLNLKMYIVDTTYYVMPRNNSKLTKRKKIENIW